MSQTNRLPAPFGRLIDRSLPVTFDFEGRTITGFKGDTIASALCANDQWMISRSFKYHRPRGVLTMAGQDANTLVQLPQEPNCLADKYPATNGLKVKAQNYLGSTATWRVVVELVHRFLPVGFYYKTFNEKKKSWAFWEPAPITAAS